MPEPPWHGRPAPRQFARACAQALTEPAAGGWQLEQYRCAGTSATHVWSRGGSQAQYLLDRVPQAVVDLSGDAAQWSTPLVLPAGPSEDIGSARELLVPLVSRFQQLGLRLAFKPRAAPTPATGLPGLKAFGPAAPPWSAYEFSVAAAGIPVEEVASGLSRPGVRLDSLTYRQGEWIVEGVAYAK